jgi:hypothetical protein
MYIHEEWGPIFEIGDFIKSKHRDIRGKVIEVDLPKINQEGYYIVGYYTIIDSNNKKYLDYHYIFELDIQRERERKLNNLLNG